MTHRHQEFYWLVARDLMIKASMLEILTKNQEIGLCPFRVYYTNYQIAVYKDTNKVQKTEIKKMRLSRRWEIEGHKKELLQAFERKDRMNDKQNRKKKNLVHPNSRPPHHRVFM